jgi:hypothetical protein
MLPIREEEKLKIIFEYLLPQTGERIKEFN